MAELEKRFFKNLPDETTPMSAEYLNEFQDNIEKVINEETTAMNNNMNKKLDDVQQQVDKTINEMKGLVDVDKVEELQQRIETVESTALFYEVIEDLDAVSADTDAESKEPSIE